MRVDNVPWYLKPFFFFYGYGFGGFLYVYSLLMHATCRIEFSEEFSSAPTAYCIWHKNLILYFTVFTRVKKQAWMNHPAWYMKPVHVLLYLTGVEHICLGSSGNSGKAALEKVISFLKQGYSTTIASDGPAGPAQQLKPGVLLMGRDANIPVMPLHFLCSNSFRLGGWDRKIVPLPFSKITVVPGKQVLVDTENFKSAETEITQHLDR
jgi:lysophospholipid acyltransferase (LPLAT)-like uncharacterized protein